jgi:hypothetical protein
MAMGQAMDAAKSLAVKRGVSPRKIDAADIVALPSGMAPLAFK